MSLAQQMSPAGWRQTRRRRRVLLAFFAVVALLGITLVVRLAARGNGAGASSPALRTSAAPSFPSAGATHLGIASPQAALRTATQAGAMALPRPAGTTGSGVPFGFPHVTEGAVSAIVRWTPLMVPDSETRQIEVLRSIGSQSFQQTQIPLLQAKYDSGGGGLPAGTWLTVMPVAVKVLSTNPNQVVVAVFELQQEGNGSGIQNASFATASNRLVWSGRDWRLDGIQDIPAALRAPESNDPSAIRDAGWEEFSL